MFRPRSDEGVDGPWLTVEKIEALLTAGEGAGVHDSASEVPQWHFNLKGQNKEGPVPWSVVEAIERRRRASAR